MERLYLKAEECPNFDKEDLIKMDIPILNFNGIEYVEINPCSYCEDWENMYIIDIEVTNMEENENTGEFNGIGNTANKDFFPCSTELIFKGGDLI